jgi:hypothetical protein
VTIPIQVLNAVNLGVTTVTVCFDPAVVDATACTANPGGVFDSGLCSPNFDNDGVAPDCARMNAVSFAGFTGNAVLANLSFTAVGPAGSVTGLTVIIDVFGDPGGNPLPATPQNGSITVGLRGDVNCDGLVNSVDGLFVLQYDVGLRGASNSCTPLPPQTLYLPQCDVNNDANCNSIDGLFILQCDVGIPNVLCPALAAPRSLSSPPQPDSGGHGPNSATLRIGGGNVSAGGSLIVPVVIPRVTNLGAVTMEVHYDPAVVRATGCSFDPGGIFDAGICAADFDADGVGTDAVRLNAISTTGFSGGAELVQITFQAVGSARSVTSIESAVSVFANVTGEALPVKTINAQVRILDR